MQKYYLIKNINGDYWTKNGSWHNKANFGMRFPDSPGKEELAEPLKSGDCVIETVYTMNRYE